MGSSYSVLDVVEPRIDIAIAKSQHRVRLQETFRDWGVENVRVVLKRLEKQKDELKKHKRVRWPALFAALEETEFELQQEIANKARKTFHPACMNFAMHKMSEEEMEEYINQRSKISEVLPKSEEGKEEKEISQLSPSPKSNGKQKIENDEEEKEGEEAEEDSSVDGDDDAVQLDSDDEEQAGISSEAIETELFDASLRSPIFFGYAQMSAEEEDEARKQKFLQTREDGQVEDKEEEMLNEEVQKVRDKYERRETKLSRERLAEKKRLEKERNDIIQAAKRERGAARKAMSDAEYNHFTRDQDKAEKDNEEKWKQQDEELRIKQQIENNAEKREMKLELGEITERMAVLFRERHAPKGEKLVEQNLELLTEIKEQVRLARSEVSIKQIELQEAIKNAGKNADKNPHRGMIMVAEGELKKVQAILEEALGKQTMQEEQLRRARELEAREARFVSLYYAVVDIDEDLAGLSYSMEIMKLILLMTISCPIVLEKKMRFIFELFATQGRDYLFENEVLSVVELTIRVLEDLGGCLKIEKKDQAAALEEEEANRDAETEGKEETAKKSPKAEGGNKKKKIRKKDMFRVRRRLKRCPREYLVSLNKRLFDTCKIKGDTEESRKMTEFEFYAAMHRLICVSQDLAQVFCVPWKYENMSKWQLTKMSYIQKYELGLYSLAELNKRIARLWVTHRPALSQDRKLEIHERSLAMGANDPLKPNYSKYMKKRKHRLQSDVIPLEHGSLGNIIHYQERLMYDSAMLVQSAWRAKVGRRLAEIETKRRAFFAAWDTALSEAKSKVERDYEKREQQAAGGVARMKWDATVRMKQVKLRAKGQTLSREEVIQLLAEEETKVAQETVNDHFKRMKDERGILNDEEVANARKLQEEKERELEFKSVLFTGQINFKEQSEKEILREAKRNMRKIKREAEKEYIKRRAFKKRGWDPDNPDDYQLKDLAEETKREDFVDMEDLDYMHGEEYTNSVPSEPQEPEDSSEREDEDEERNLSPNGNQSADGRGKLSPEEEEESAKLTEQIMAKMQLIPTEIPPVTLPKSHLSLDSRKSILDYGGMLETFYNVGNSELEEAGIVQFRSSFPSHAALQGRLERIGTTMTPKKVEEFLQELPSKRLILRFLKRFEGRPIHELEHELSTHFGLLRREVSIVAKSLRAICQQDMETGAMRKRTIVLLESLQREVHPLAAQGFRIAYDEIERREKAAARSKKTKLENEARRKALESGVSEEGDFEDSDDDEEEEDIEDEDGMGETEGEKDLKGKNEEALQKKGISSQDLENLTEPVGREKAQRGNGKSRKETRQDAVEEEELQGEREPTQEEIAKAETETRKNRVKTLRENILKSMAQLKMAELELERSERLEQAIQKRQNEQEPFIMDTVQAQSPSISDSKATSKSENPTSSDLIAQRLAKQLSQRRVRSVSFHHLGAGLGESGGLGDGLSMNSAPEELEKERMLRKARQARKTGWLELKRATKISGMGVGAKEESVAGQWFRELELGSVNTVSGSERENWMERYRQIIDLSEGTAEEQLEKYTQLHNLYEEFLHVAKTIGKTIILEKYSPDAKKSILPFRYRESDVGRGDMRSYYLAGNIHFKFATDDDGICNGSDEFAEKYHGHSIRNSVAMLKCDMSRLVIPFEALIEYNGTRLHAVAHVAKEMPIFDAKGVMKRSEVEMVLGSEDRGKTIFNSDKNLDRLLKQVAQNLSIANHGVKGERDLLPKYIYTPGDLRGYKDHHSSTFYLLNFRRLFPPEDPDETPHLQLAPRGHSIFWRQLRPEWIKHIGLAQSSDAFSLFTLDTPDFQRFNRAAKEATVRLMTEQIPEYAEELCRRTDQELDEMNVAEEMHARGINLRHLGLVRSKFWRQVRGTVRVTFSERILICSHDVTTEVKPGSHIRMRKDLFKVSTDPADPYDCETRTITIAREPRPERSEDDIEQASYLDRVELNDHVPLYSSHQEVMYTGVVTFHKNSRRVRGILLAEMLARTFKHITKALLRQLCEELEAPSEICTERTLLLMLNLITGSGDGSTPFWTKEVVYHIEQRFGTCALGEVEKLNLRVIVEDDGILSTVTLRFLEFFDVELTEDCHRRFIESCGKVKGCPCLFLFTVADFRRVGCRVKHNLFLLEFCKGLILAKQAKDIHRSTYEATMLRDEPTGYWPLSERPGSKVAVNRGSLGLRLSGKISDCRLGVDGFVKNQWPNRATQFPMYRSSEEGGDELVGPDEQKEKEGLMKGVKKEKAEERREREETVSDEDDGEETNESGMESDESDLAAELRRKRQAKKEGDNQAKGPKARKKRSQYLATARIDAPFHDKVVPQERTQAFSIEAWARTDTMDGKERYILRSGRYALMTNSSRGYSFVIYDSVYAVSVSLSSEAKRLDSKWHYLVGTFDGTMARLYVDTVLVDQVDYDEEARQLSRGYAKRQAKLEVERREKELSERNNAASTAKAEGNAYFKSKQGQIFLSSAAKRLVSRSEARIKLNQEKAKILGIRSITTAEARVQAMADWVKSRTCDHLEQITEKHRKIIQKRQELHKRKIAQAEVKATLPLRIGATFATTKAPKNCFVGEIQHVAVFLKEVGRDSINARYLMAVRDLKHDAERLYNESAKYFESSLVRCYDTSVVLDHYATAMANRAAVDSDGINDVAKYLGRIRKNLGTFERKRNARGIASLLVSMPDNSQFGPMVAECWGAMKRVDELFFTKGSFNERRRRMQQLESVPERFNMAGLPSVRRPMLKEVASEIYQYVLRHNEDFYGPHVGLVSWLSKLQNPSLVCYMVGLIKQVLNRKSKQDQFRKYMEQRARMNLLLEEDRSSLDGPTMEDIAEMERECQRCLFSLDISSVTTCIEDVDLDLISDNIRTLENINLAKCVNLKLDALSRLAQQCKFLDSLLLLDCKVVGDELLKTVAENCTGLRELDVSGCTQVSDVGMAVIARKCLNLRHLKLNRCEQISDLGMAESAPHLRKLETLEVSWCLLISNVGLFKFSSTGPAKTLKQLSLAGCRRLSDDGIHEMCKHLTGLTSLDVSFCNKITDAGGISITHSLLDLETLNLSDLYQLSDRTFFFDSVGDGRAQSDQRMLSRLRRVNLCDLRHLSDHAVSELARRASSLSFLRLSGCSNLSPNCISAITHCPITSLPRASHLVSLDLSHTCAAHHIAHLPAHCAQLEHLDLSGCTHLQDAHVRALAQGCGGLQSLVLAHCRMVSDETIVVLADALWVERVDLSHCVKISDKAMAAIAANWPGLARLGMAWCRRISDKGVGLLGEGCKGLERIDARGCEGISKNAWEKFKEENCVCEVVTRNEQVDQREDMERAGTEWA